MYRQFLAAILMLAFTMQTFNQGLVVFGFYANQEAIAQKLCINKAKPKMHCNGKCQLMKKLQEEEKKDKENSERKIENKTDIVFIKISDIAVCYAPAQVENHNFSLYKEPLLSTHPIEVFHPPQL